MDEIFTSGEVVALSNISQANEAYATSEKLDPEVQTAFVRHLAIAQRLVIRGSIKRRNAGKPKRAPKPATETPTETPTEPPATE